MKWLLLCLVFGELSFAQNFCADLLNQDFKHTLISLEQMRGPNGLVQDTIWVKKKKNGHLKTWALNSNTSLTNIAVDLLVQAQLGNLSTLQKIISTLNEFSFHQDSGLFFSWYSTTPDSSIKDRSVSSIDNLHLALALWTVKENFPIGDFGTKAADLFNRMDFSVFYDPASKLIGGNLRFEEGKWTREEYNFSHFGSEARILYNLGWALGLFKSYPQDQSFIKAALTNLTFETTETDYGKVLKLWDGALFQLYFPKIFINEELYSAQMAEFYQSTAKLIIAEGERRDLQIPAGHSPGRAAYNNSSRTDQPTYKDKSGVKSLISSYNNDVLDARLYSSWEDLFTPYAMFMAATSNPEIFAEAMTYARSIQSQGRSLYIPEMGWMDGLLFSNFSVGKIIPAQLSLNQGMIALSILQMNAPDGLSLSSRSLYGNPKIRRRLQVFYKLLDETLNSH